MTRKKSPDDMPVASETMTPAAIEQIKRNAEDCIAMLATGYAGKCVSRKRLREIITICTTGETEDERRREDQKPAE